MSDQALLDEVRDAAEAVLEARANGGELDAAREGALAAARAALDGGVAIAAIAAAEAEGERAARERLGGQVLRLVERSAKRLRDATSEYERAIAQAVDLGLAARDIAARAGVSHGTVAAVARRHEQAKPAPPERAAHHTGDDGDTAEPASAGEASSGDAAGVAPAG
jgi:DNA-binding NarL/FixJ family response regulator